MYEAMTLEDTVKKLAESTDETEIEEIVLNINAGGYSEGFDDGYSEGYCDGYTNGTVKEEHTMANYIKRCEGDSEHEIVKDVKLNGIAELHRFNNPAGIPYSAIYVDGTEFYSAERGREAGMIEYWNSRTDLKGSNQNE